MVKLTFRAPYVCLMYVQELGADEVIDYTREAFHEVLKANPVDVVIDPIGGEPPCTYIESKQSCPV